MLYTTVHSYI
ncbi:hypothetical protein HID58_087579 [Brassica napus]|uniref:Uncharacterized protein n=1 Tax=Brassica napus TaxID=3708 RepID=A0ABQ7XW93_BRANA|nr:hypothetical protein HID58_087579 [Brassica napus]